MLNRAKTSLDQVICWRNRSRQGALGEFYCAGGVELLFNHFDLTSSDWVIDAGGFRGEWADEILCRYGAKIVIAEPNPHYAERLRNRYKANDRVEVTEVALSDRAGYEALSLCDEGSSLIKSTSSVGTVDVRLEEISQFVEARFKEGVGCLKLNVEGAEYEILENLLSKDQTRQIRFILVQFHKGPSNSVERRQKIQEKLSKTHKKIFDFPFVWELWRAETLKTRL